MKVSGKRLHTLRPEPFFCPFEWVGEKDWGSAWIRLAWFSDVRGRWRSLSLPSLSENLESGQTFVVAKAWTSDLVNLVNYRQTGFPSVSIRLFINRWSFLSPLYQVHVY